MTTIVVGELCGAGKRVVIFYELTFQSVAKLGLQLSAFLEAFKTKVDISAARVSAL